MKLAVAQFDSTTAVTSRVAPTSSSFDRLGGFGSPAPKLISLSKPGFRVAVQRHVYRSADDDGDEPTLLSFADPERPGLRLRIADAGDDALIDRRISDTVDDDVVALILQSSDRLVGVPLWVGSAIASPAARARRPPPLCCCHTPACAHDSLHSVVCLVFVLSLADTRCCRAFLSNLCGINGRAAVCLARALSLRGGVAQRPHRHRRRRPGFVALGESGPIDVSHGPAERLRGGRPVQQGRARRVLGLGPDWTADPPRCGALADPAPTRRRHEGGRLRVPAGSSTPWSPTRRRRRSVLIDECGQWTVFAGHTGGTSRSRRRPRSTARRPWASTTTTTTVEGGTETIRTPTPSPPIWAAMSRLSRRRRSGLTESSTRTGFRGGFAGENGVGVAR